MPTCKPSGLALLLALVAVPAARAHDFWIEPSSFTPAPGQRVAVRLRVGQELRGDPVPRELAELQRFVMVGPRGEGPVPGLPNTDPAGFAAFDSPGLYTVVYDSGRHPLELDAAKFEQYLSQEGLEKIAGLRARRGQTASGAKEVFSRCAKSLIAVGPANVAGIAGGSRYDQPLGERLELVPETNPYALTGGGELPVRLLYEGKPLAGALVVALPKDRKAEPVSARSDSKGRVRLKLDHPGFWLVKAVHMIPAPRETGADWESFWASLTFGVPER